jgi:mannan endo-1,4-beta-mannosidase
MKQVASQLLAFSMFILLSIQLQSCYQRGQNQHLSENAGLLLQYIHNISGKYTLTGQHNYLSQLSMAPNSIIPILFRPYHEMNGSWFWWGGVPGEDRYIKLWKQLYKLYTEEYQLDNLIWVWSPDDPDHGLDGYYPGDDYVDIIGCDVYHFGKQRPYYMAEKYKRITSISPGKPVCIGECSEIPSESVLEEQSLWTWFMAWDVLVFQMNSSDKLREIYQSDRFITRDELPDFNHQQ